MPLLSVVDLSGTNIAAYSGTEGTEYINFDYPTNQVPSAAFFIEPWVGSTNLSSIQVPASVNSIGRNAFGYCSLLTTFEIPVTVTTIEEFCFYKCHNLTSIIANPSYPPDLLFSSNVFTGVDMTTCTLYVPYQSKFYYGGQDLWKDFTHIIENAHGFLLGYMNYKFPAEGGENTDYITSNMSWKTNCDQTWLMVNPASGNGDHEINIIVDANTSVATRTAKVTVSVKDIPSQSITVIQEGAPKTINLAAGTLSSELTSAELNEITKLIITGNIDARDFKTMRDDMPVLAVIDLSKANIAAYSGMEGTIDNFTDYPANTIPPKSFGNIDDWNRKSILTSLLLPASITSIGYSAFAHCTNLTTFDIPPTVTSIDACAFYDCTNLTFVKIPFSITSIENDLFYSCTNLTTVDIPSSVTSIGNKAFYYCRYLSSLTIPSSVTSIKGYAFADCEWLTSITIPSSISIIENSAFSNCSRLKSIFSNASNPPDLTQSPGVFFGVNKTTCILHVPPGSRNLYAEATVWKQFINIVETPLGLNEVEKNIAEFKCYPNPFTQEIVIEIPNPERTKITVDIYNIAGQKVKNLANGNTDEQMKLLWNGTNDLGQKVPQGVYICKMNEQSKQLIFNFGKDLYKR